MKSPSRSHEDAALILREEMKYEPKKDQITFEKAIEEASGSADWLYPEEEYAHLILQASTMYEEDYWHIMERMSQIHHQQKSG